MFTRKMNEFQDYTQVKQEDYKVKLDDWVKHQEEVLSLIYRQIILRAKHIHQKFIDKLQKMRKNILTRDLPPGIHR